MKQIPLVFRVLFVFLIFPVIMSTDSHAADPVRAGQWYETGIAMPMAKVGGGEYFVVLINEPGVEYDVHEGVIRLRFEDIGDKRIKVTVRRIEKSSCGGVSARDVVEKTVELTVVPNK